MVESFLFIALPYIALVVCIGGSIYRAKNQSITYSALSSQFLEGRSLLWGSLPWHIGIITILLAHVVALLFPGLWQACISYPPVLIACETIGITLATGCLVGLFILLVRRLVSGKVQAVTSTMDLVVLALLLIQVALGLGIATGYRWGAAWSTGTMAPYIWSLLTFQPNISYIEGLPVIAKAHIVLAWVIILIIPCSRLIHMFALPIHYLFRAPQNVVWNNSRRLDSDPETIEETAGRRYFLRGSLALTAGGLLLSVGAIEKVFRFFFGPRLTKAEEGEIMSTRLKRLEKTAEQRKLELERQQSNYIYIAALSELSDKEGKYFIDYEMRPGLAFRGKDGLPNLLSAKCTHLGCTVSNQVDAQGRILCPCHVSYFDIFTGIPNAGAPAKDPLPHLSWVLMDKQGKVLTSRAADGNTKGNTNGEALKEAQLYIVKEGGGPTST
ncbi:MAG: respiratory nitrate reductase subunit gamma [Candidatus Obscuribacterales bacterium]|nr:respiratory nitrate reductase subunit gamma [Candidatus Obscuribacterales bacterium]